MKPTEVNGLYMAGPIGIAFCMLLAQRLSTRIGRVQTTVLCRVLGVVALLAISFVDSAGRVTRAHARPRHPCACLRAPACC